jgi:hypothetical protein
LQRYCAIEYAPRSASYLTVPLSRAKVTNIVSFTHSTLRANPLSNSMEQFVFRKNWIMLEHFHFINKHRQDLKVHHPADDMYKYENLAQNSGLLNKTKRPDEQSLKFSFFPPVWIRSAGRALKRADIVRLLRRRQKCPSFNGRCYR